MRHLRTLLLVGLTLLSSLAFGQDTNSILWKISGNGLESPSFLFGTIHVQCPENIMLSAAAEKAFSTSEQLVLEIDMDAPDFQSKMQTLSVNEGMKNISSQLSEEELASVNAFFKKYYATDLSQLGVMKPFVLLSLMSMKGLDCPQTGSYEEFLLAKAKEKKWEINGLEKAEDQIAIFNSIELKEQLSWLVEIANDEEAYRKELQKMVLAYEKQNFDRMHEVMKGNPQYEFLGYELFEKRNKNWISEIEKYAKDKPTFFAFGAGHLGESYGVIQLLKKEGYTVEPITNNL